jgi:uncharacterized surface protein with fasciclin (FAS1) repeats
MYRRTLAGLTMAGALLLSACADDGSTALLAPEAPAENRAPAPGADPIAAIAAAAGFDELVGALTYVDGELGVGLVELFRDGTDQFTVFAPTDEAFENLYGLLSAVLDAPISEVTDIPATVVLDVLLYHVAEGRRAANSVLPRVGTRTITPLLGETFQVRADGTIRDGLTGLRTDAAITGANISASNGIIHVIDQVIVPPSVVAALTN